MFFLFLFLHMSLTLRNVLCEKYNMGFKMVQATCSRFLFGYLIQGEHTCVKDENNSPAVFTGRQIYLFVIYSLYDTVY